MYVEKAAETTFIWKIQAFNVDEIEPSMKNKLWAIRPKLKIYRGSLIFSVTKCSQYQLTPNA